MNRTGKHVSADGDRGADRAEWNFTQCFDINEPVRTVRTSALRVGKTRGMPLYRIVRQAYETSNYNRYRD